MPKVFEAKVARAVETLRKILDDTRRPVLASPSIDHEYADKYALAEFATATALAAQLQILQMIGLAPAALGRLRAAAAEGRAVTLRLSSAQTCEFIRTAKRDVEVGPKVVQSGIFAKETQVVQTVTEQCAAREPNTPAPLPPTPRRHGRHPALRLADSGRSASSTRSSPSSAPRQTRHHHARPRAAARRTARW